MRMPVAFSWKVSPGERVRGEGVTRDMSTSGVFILTEKCPPVDAMIAIEVISSADSNVSKAVIKAHMKVLRTESDKNIGRKRCSGFAATGKTVVMSAVP